MCKVIRVLGNLCYVVKKYANMPSYEVAQNIHCLLGYVGYCGYVGYLSYQFKNTQIC